MSIKFCANISFLFQETASLLDRYNLAKDAGFKAVECAFPYDLSADDVAQAKTKAGIEHVMINAYPGNWSKGDRGIAAIPGRESEFKSSIEKSVEYAKKLDCKKIHIMAGIVERETQQHMEVYKNNLRLASGIFTDNGITGLIEPINRYSLPNYYLNSYQRASTVIQEINSPNLKLQLDVFHLQQISGNLTKNIQQLYPMIGHIQIAQVPDRHEPDSLGEINFQYVLTVIKKLGYDGWIGLEYVPATNTKDGLAWMSKITI